MPEPALSAVLVTLDDWTNMRNTLRALRAQTLREQMELVFVGPSLDALDLPEAEFQDFAGIQKTAEPVLTTLGQAYAAGVRAATAPLVLFTEDHCYPEPQWAELLVARHASGTWAGVGPTVINANPASTASCAQFLIEYGQYSETGKKGPCRQIPGHNSCYRRKLLLHYGAKLFEWLECETLMQWDMADRGLTFYMDDQVRTRHFNCSRLSATFMFSWYFSRQFAAYRGRRMTARDRAKLALLWPLIPIVRLKRIWPLMASLLGFRRALSVLPAVATNLAISGAGEGLGYLTCDPGAREHCFHREFHRERFLRPGEQLVVREPKPTAAARDRGDPLTCASTAASSERSVHDPRN